MLMPDLRRPSLKQSKATSTAANRNFKIFWQSIIIILFDIYILHKLLAISTNLMCVYEYIYNMIMNCGIVVLTNVYIYVDIVTIES